MFCQLVNLEHRLKRFMAEFLLCTLPTDSEIGGIRTGKVTVQVFFNSRRRSETLI